MSSVVSKNMIHIIKKLQYKEIKNTCILNCLKVKYGLVGIKKKKKKIHGPC